MKRLHLTKRISVAILKRLPSSHPSPFGYVKWCKGSSTIFIPYWEINIHY